MNKRVGNFRIAVGVLIVVLSSITFAAEDVKQQKSPFSFYPFKIPDQYQDELESYRSWVRVTGIEYSGLHWGQFVLIYMNKAIDVYRHNYETYVEYYIEGDEDEWDEEPGFKLYPSGTVFIKENYLAEHGAVGRPMTLTMMIKREPGYDPKFNNWEYVQSAVSGDVIMQGKLNDPQIYQACGECHESMNDRDYIFSTYYSNRD